MKKTYFVIVFMLLVLPHPNVIYGFDSLPTAIPNGTTGQVLTARTNDTPYWATPSFTGTVAIANGGTGATTQQGAINALAGAQTSGQYLRGNGTNVSMSAIQAADIMGTSGDAYGLFGFIGSGNPSTVKSGPDGYVLTARGNSLQPYWAAPSGGGGGKVLQVVYGSTTSEYYTNSGYVAATNLSQSILTTNDSSKVLISIGLNMKTGGGICGIKILRGATQIYLNDNMLSGTTVTATHAIEYLDTPGAIATYTYNVEFKQYTGGGGC